MHRASPERTERKLMNDLAGADQPLPLPQDAKCHHPVRLLHHIVQLGCPHQTPTSTPNCYRAFGFLPAHAAKQGKMRDKLVQGTLGLQNIKTDKFEIQKVQQAKRTPRTM
mmetsp:Transcript_117170/g.233471  ORF Transcript_117170/g.233471 Transcript_117170/m.233471 type:complete len:110 (+) Transcript_117170:3-332(+)